MFEYVRIWQDLFAPAIPVAALKFDLREEVPRYPVDLVELRVGAAERAMIGILSEPVPLAVRAYGFLTYFTL